MIAAYRLGRAHAKAKLTVAALERLGDPSWVKSCRLQVAAIDLKRTLHLTGGGHDPARRGMPSRWQG
jgi:hypothetical protein